jgi:hypothetical protein
MYPHERSLVEKLKDKPFALLGVNSDRDREKLKKIIEEKKLTWRSFWNGPQGTGGPISEEWNVQGWPTVYLIDHTGVIRVKNPQATEKGEKGLDEHIDKLIKEAEAAAKGGDK